MHVNYAAHILDLPEPRNEATVRIIYQDIMMISITIPEQIIFMFYPFWKSFLRTAMGMHRKNAITTDTTIA